MKAKLFFMLLLGAVSLTNAQEHTITWASNIPQDQFSITVEVGETVTWVCSDFFPHSIVSTGGAETFNSGPLYMNSFSHQFENVGATTYWDGTFRTQMQGTITVTAVAGVKDVTNTTFSMYPNPATDFVMLKSNNVIDAITIYDMTGRQLFTAKAGANLVNVAMATYPAGTYMVKANAGKAVKTMAVIKQ